jgi:hypothetical protein
MANSEDIRIVQFQFPADDAFSMDTSVALIMAKTASPLLKVHPLDRAGCDDRSHRPGGSVMTISETTLSDTISSIVPGK